MSDVQAMLAASGAFFDSEEGQRIKRAEEARHAHLSLTFRRGFEEGYAVALAAAKDAVAQHDKAGREWVKGSLRDTLTKEACGRIDKLG